MVGPTGSPGEESFDFAVCSPTWLAAEAEHQRIISGRFYLISARFDFGAVEQHVRNQVALATGNSWTEIATKLARWSHWEFEDYTRYRP
jgi:hypothetical protein